MLPSGTFGSQEEMLPDKYRFTDEKFSPYLVQFKETASAMMVAATLERQLTYLHFRCEFRQRFHSYTEST